MNDRKAFIAKTMMHGRKVDPPDWLLGLMEQEGVKVIRPGEVKEIQGSTPTAVFIDEMVKEMTEDD